MVLRMSVLSLPAHALGPVRAHLDRHRAVRYQGVLESADCRDLIARLYGAQDRWTPAFEGVQFSLGRAFYTDLEEDRATEYFAAAPWSDRLVREVLPGLQERMMATLATLVGATVVQRAGWCGPGVHVFPAGEWLSENGGEVHFDLEGLLPHQRATNAPALTTILMLQPPERGGDLCVWDRLDDGTGDEPIGDPDCVEYGEGDLVVIDSRRLHQIAPFEGTRDRVSATAHVALDGDQWQAWF